MGRSVEIEPPSGDRFRTPLFFHFEMIQGADSGADAVLPFRGERGGVICQGKSIV